MNCYRSGGCGPYEMLSCSECPANKPEYIYKTMKCDMPTYADRIRAMTDAELAEWMAANTGCNFCKLDCKAREQSSTANCVSHWLKWLQSSMKRSD